MGLSRRGFLKLCGTAGLMLGTASWLTEEVVRALEEAVEGGPHVLWLQGASDAGCSISVLNTVHPDIAEVLLGLINCNFHPNLMTASGALATSVLEEAASGESEDFILVFEGAIPTANNGVFCTVGELGGAPVTMLEWVKVLGARAQAVLAVGTCAAYGGIPAATPNPTGCKGIGSVLRENGIETQVVNIPGCPAHPDWVVGTLFHVLRYGLPEVDSLGRPRLFYDHLIHDNCLYRSFFDRREFAQRPGEEKCLFWLGCKGPDVYADCPSRLWNSGVNWCVHGGAPCIGCTHPNFPDGTSPFYFS